MEKKGNVINSPQNKFSYKPMIVWNKKHHLLTNIHLTSQQMCWNESL